MSERIVKLDAYVCPPTTTVREALARLDAVSGTFQLVAAEDGRLLGTLTDGDVRRALLHGTTLDDPVAECMQADFVAGRTGQVAENRRLLTGGPKQVNFLPVLDPNGRVEEVLIRAGGAAPIQCALVMAGGFGRRLGERTKGTPKPLLSVGGRPILDHVLAALEDVGVPRLMIAVHYLSEQIEAFVAGRDNRAAIEIVREAEPLGTAGALSLVADRVSSPLLVVNGDVLTQVDFPSLDAFHRRHGHDATVAVTRHETEIPYGVVRYGKDGLFEKVEEKPRVSNFVAAGVYYLAPEFLALTTPGQRLDMPDLLNRGKEIGLQIGLFPIHEYWADVGRPEDLAEAEANHTSVGAYPKGGT